MIELCAAATPNGHKVTIMLDEVDLDCRLYRLGLSVGDHRRDYSTPTSRSRSRSHMGGGRCPTLARYFAGSGIEYDAEIMAERPAVQGADSSPDCNPDRRRDCLRNPTGPATGANVSR